MAPEPKGRETEVPEPRLGETMPSNDRPHTQQDLETHCSTSQCPRPAYVYRGHITTTSPARLRRRSHPHFSSTAGCKFPLHLTNILRLDSPTSVVPCHAIGLLELGGAASLIGIQNHRRPSPPRRPLPT